MAFCKNCGAELNDGEKFCASCGAPTETKSNDFNEKVDETVRKVADLNNTEDTTSEFDPEDIEKNKIYAVLSYLGILVLVPIIAAKDSKFAMYHANQGLVLFLASIVLTSLAGALANAIGILSVICSILDLLVFILEIIGIVNAVNGRAKELPVIGQFRIINY